jgi:hypothetical protein
MKLRLSVVILLLALGGRASAQNAAPARELTTTAAIQRPASEAPEADLYYFVGEPGSHQRFTVTSTKPVEITLFSPAGVPMLSKEGTGTVTLDAVLSWLDVHTVAVLRSSPATPYTLKRSATKPTYREAVFAINVGDEVIAANGSKSTQCWLIPGEKLGFVGSEATTTLSRSGDGAIGIYPTSTGVVVNESWARIDDESVIRSTQTFPGGAKQETRTPLDIATFQRPPTLGTYKGYYCPGAPQVH